MPQLLTVCRRAAPLASPVGRRAALLGLLATAGCATRPPPPLGAADAPASEVVFLVQRDWHTDIGLAVADLQGDLATLGARWPGASHLVLGFGERAYLLSRHRSLADMAMALVPGPGAMLVTGLSVAPSAAFGAADALALRVTSEGFARLQRYLAESFEWEADGAPRRLADGPYAGAEFYGAALTYSAGFTCNTWVAEALAQAGLPVRVRGVLFAGQVMEQARRLAGP